MLPKLKYFFTHNIGLKLWSLALAMILWYAVQGEREIEAYIDVEVQIKNRPKNLIITNDVADHVQLLVHGSQSSIKALRERPLPPYIIDLQSSTAGSALYKVFGFDFKLPERVSIVRLSPQNINVVLEELASKRLPVEAHLVGELENGFVIEQIDVQPSSVVVWGSETALAALQKIQTREINLRGVRQSLRADYALLLHDKNNIRIDGEAQVQVSVLIREKVITENITEIPIETEGHLPKGVTIEPQVGALMLQGPAGLINDLSKQKPRLYVEIPGVDLKPLIGRNILLKVQHAVPARAEVLKIVPDVVGLQ